MALLNAKAKALLDRLQKKSVPQEIVAVDFSQAEIKCARLRRTNGGIQLVAADVLPRIANETAEDRKDVRRSITLPKHLLCRHAVLCLSGKNALLKLLSMPGNLENDLHAKIREDMGVGAGEYRIGYKILGHGHSRGETKLLAVAVPEGEIKSCLDYFSSGWPVPVSVEVGGLAALDAFISANLESCPDESLGVVQFEDEASFFAFFHKKELVLIRKYDFGQDHILNTIQRGLNVNRETALNVAFDRAFDISQMLKEVCDPFIHQFVISKHFVERRENCRVSRIFLPAAAAASNRLAEGIRAASEAEVEEWEPLKAVIVQPEAIAPKLTAPHCLLMTLIGAGVGFLKEQMET